MGRTDGSFKRGAAVMVYWGGEPAHRRRAQQEAASPSADAGSARAGSRGKPDDPARPSGFIGRRERCRLWGQSGDGRQLRVILRLAPPSEAAPYLPICDAADISS